MECRSSTKKSHPKISTRSRQFLGNDCSDWFSTHDYNGFIIDDQLTE